MVAKAKAGQNVWSERLILLGHHPADSMGSFTKKMMFFLELLAIDVKSQLMRLYPIYTFNLAVIVKFLGPGRRMGGIILHKGAKFSTIIVNKKSLLFKFRKCLQE